MDDDDNFVDGWFELLAVMVIVLLAVFGFVLVFT